MKQLISYHGLLIPVWLCLASMAAVGQELECSPEQQPEQYFTVDELVFVGHSVFDAHREDSFYIHRLANRLHINTQQYVVENLLPFAKDDSISQTQITEAERLLNQHNFLRKSEIRLTQDCANPARNVVRVNTWDTWSLLPFISFGRKAGNNKYAVGFKEDNFLGMGIHTKIQYKKDHQRAGYQFSFSMPLQLAENSTVEFEFSDNDDGQRHFISYSQPFYLQSTERQYTAAILSDKRQDSIYQSGHLLRQFVHQIKRSDAAYGHLIAKYGDNAMRLHLGIRQEQHRFTEGDNSMLSALPFDREFTAPWIGFEYSEADYQRFSNIRFINQREDINLGWHFITKTAADIHAGKDKKDKGLHVENRLSKGMQWQDTLVLLAATHQVYWQKTQPNNQKTSAEIELHQYLTPSWAAYLKSQWRHEKNQYPDEPLALGGENGVRGYSQQYQHGEHLWAGNAELRYNPHWELYQLVNVAWAAFMDSGKAWGNTHTKNHTSKTLNSLGIGARLFSSHSSEGSVVHIDLIKPLTKGVNVDNWQWQLQVKKSL